MKIGYDSFKFIHPNKNVSGRRNSNVARQKRRRKKQKQCTIGKTLKTAHRKYFTRLSPNHLPAMISTPPPPLPWSSLPLPPLTSPTLPCAPLPCLPAICDIDTFNRWIDLSHSILCEQSIASSQFLLSTVPPPPPSPYIPNPRCIT